MNKPIVKDFCDRGKLIEGRNYNMGFAFCKRVGKNEYHTVQPISPCKDYLNDVLFSEHTGKNFSACGLHTQKQGIFDGESMGYIAIQMLEPKGGKYPLQEPFADVKARLRANFKNIEKLLNHVEDEFVAHGQEIPDRTAVVESTDPDIFLLYVPFWWCRTTHLISLYSLLVRMAQFWDGEGNPASFLETYNNPLDKGLWVPNYGVGAKIKYKCMLKYGVRITTPQELAEAPTPNVHGNGILHY